MPAGDPLSLRVLLDGSAVEVFTSTGESLTTRMYRGHPPQCVCAGCGPAAAPAAPTSGYSAVMSSSNSDDACVEDEAGIALFASGAAVTVSELCVWEMGSCWVPPTCPPPQPPALLQQQLAATHHTPAAAAAGAEAGLVPEGVPVVFRTKSEAAAEVALHCRIADIGSTGSSAAAATAGGGGEVVGVHHPAGGQAVVKEAFLEELHILANQ